MREVYKMIIDKIKQIVPAQSDWFAVYKDEQGNPSEAQRVIAWANLKFEPAKM